MDLTRYLSELDGQYRIFDVGRRIRKLDKNQFQHFESQDIPYPFPYLQHAWLALFITQKGQLGNETLWFLKWPLDEQGKLIPYVRDDLVGRLMALDKQPKVRDSSMEDPLKDNPFSFNPDDIRRANLHSLIQAQMHRKPSEHYDAVVNFLQAGTLNPQHLSEWQHLGMQGISDVASRLESHKSSLAHCLARMPSEVYLAFAQCLEHQIIPHDIAQAVSVRLNKDLQQDDQVVAVEAGMRIIGSCHSDELRINTWKAWLNSTYKDQVAVMLTFATRNYDDLAFIPEHIEEFLVSLANLNGNFNSFIKIVGDLLYLPGTRNLLLNVLRNENRPEILAQALQALLDSKK
jgi:hypothetical protein